MRSAPCAKGGEYVPHQRFGDASAARLGVDGKVFHERPRPAQRRPCQPTLAVDNQETQGGVEFRVA